MDTLINTIVANPQIVAGLLVILALIVGAAFFNKSGLPCQCPTCAPAGVMIPNAQGQLTYNPMSYEAVTSGNTLMTYLFGFLLFIAVIWVVQQINEKYNIEKTLSGLAARGRGLVR
jgi:hypothetical protein